MNTKIYPIREGEGSEPASLELSQKLNEWLGHSGPTGLFRTCGSCAMMRREGPAHCAQYNMTPPIAVIMTGCEEYKDDATIPF